MLAHLGLYEDAKRFCDWLETAEWFDSRGPKKTGEWLGEVIGGTAHAVSKASAQAAAQSIDEIWNQWEKIRQTHPGLGWLYWPLVAALYLTVLCLPILLLRTAETVAQWLREQGIAACQSMSGGIDAWSALVDPAVPRY